MDQRGSLVDTNIKIYPSEQFIAFIETIPVGDDVPHNILKYINDTTTGLPKKEGKVKINDCQIQFTQADIENISTIKEAMACGVESYSTNNECVEKQDSVSMHDELEDTEHKKGTKENDTRKSTQNEIESNEDKKEDDSEDKIEDDLENKVEDDSDEKNEKLYLTTSDIDWLYAYINKRKKEGEENVPFLHELFQGTTIAMPENRLIKRNPVLEARCVKLRAQQEAREYRKMTKGVDNVRMRYPEDSISYQMKQINRQLIAIGQFILSIFAGFLFGFRGIEWMIGNLDFGVRLLLGVMCALIIALAEIYFLAKKLNEELAMTETVQIGGPPKFSNQPDYRSLNTSETVNKEHQD